MAQLRTDAPSILYKLRGIENFARDVRDLLEERRLFAARPSSLNDPYDLLPALRVPPTSRRNRWKRRAIKELAREGLPEAEAERRCDLLCESPRHRERFMDGLLDAYGVVSLSQPIESPVLWAHYASTHRGFAVGYRARTDGQLEALPAFPVLYRKRRVSMYPFGPEPNWLAILRTKAKDWAYEKEWRYVRPENAGGPGLMDVPERAIVEVCLGLRISRSHTNAIVQAAHKLPDQPRVLRARLHPERFELLFEQIG